MRTLMKLSTNSLITSLYSAQRRWLLSGEEKRLEVLRRCPIQVYCSTKLHGKQKTLSGATSYLPFAVYQWIYVPFQRSHHVISLPRRLITCLLINHRCLCPLAYLLIIKLIYRSKNLIDKITRQRLFISWPSSKRNKTLPFSQLYYRANRDSGDRKCMNWTLDLPCIQFHSDEDEEPNRYTKWHIYFANLSPALILPVLMVHL